MADKEGRVRLLRTLQILQNETDEQHPISIVQLEKELMARWEIPAFRITVQSDIAALRQAGHDIAVIKSTQNRYYYRSRLFEPAELKLLIDAVESGRFITEQKSRDLTASSSRWRPSPRRKTCGATPPSPTASRRATKRSMTSPTP